MPRRSLLSIEQRTRLFAIPVDHAESRPFRRFQA
jgi:hypothetical protein